MTITFNTESLQKIALFEKVSHAKVRDLFETPTGMTVVVEQNDMQKAIGKDAKTITRLKELFKKNIRLIEYHPQVMQFIRNVAKPVRLVDVQEQDGVYTLVVSDHKSRGLLIGRNANILRHNESIVQRYFPVKELKIITSNGD